MAENSKFNNSGMFKDVTNDNGHTGINTENTSEVLATQGNVINSIKTFWNNLRAKLVYAITRSDTTTAVGSTYIPVYVDVDGNVNPCNGEQITVSNSNINNNNNISIKDISPIIGTTLSILVTTDITSSNQLEIGGKKVFYPTGIEVDAKITANTNLLVVYNGEGWILINKMNEVKASSKTSSSSSSTGGYSGLMTADDKAKLDTIDWGANNYSLPTADINNTGGVKLGYTTNGKNYKVQKDTNNNLYVNVPWTDNDTHNTALLRAGTGDSKDNEVTTNGYTYLKIVDGGNKSSAVKISGSGDTSVSSDSNGNITISSPDVPSYNTLSTNNNDITGSYIIRGPGLSNASEEYYLAGNGTWVKGILVPIPNTSDSGKSLKCDDSGNLYWGE